MDAVLSVGLFVVAAFALAAFGPALFMLLANHGHYTVLHVRRSELSLIPGQILQGQRLAKVGFWARAFAAAAIVSATVLAALYIGLSVWSRTQ